MKKTILMAMLCLVTIIANAEDKCAATVSGLATTMSNGIVNFNIGTDGRITTFKYNNKELLGSGGKFYFDYTAAANTALSPSKAEIVKLTDDYAEVLYSNTSAGLQFQQGFILRKGVSGVYMYIIANGTSTSSTVNLREARVCFRMNSSNFTYGYVNDSMQGTLPTVATMKAVDTSGKIQDATFKLPDGTIYTKYNWVNYVAKDSVHGLMSSNVGVWNIPCSTEYGNGGPMKQELTVHTDTKSPLTIQMLQGEHMGASSQYYQDGEKKIYGPFFFYINSGTQKEMIADAKEQAAQQEQQWPFEWFENSLYPTKRCTVSGHLEVTTKQTADSVQMVLAEPDIDMYKQGKKYIYWALTDANGDFKIKNVRSGDYTLYGYATKGEVTDQLEKADINISEGIDNLDLGTVTWTPAKYETMLWRIGENNRLSDGYELSDSLRAYGLFNTPPATLAFTIGSSNPKTDWYYAQTKNGTWTVCFDCPQAYTGKAYFTTSIAGTTNKPKLAVGVNGTNVANWSFGNDAAIYRSALLSGNHYLQTCSFDASLLKQGANTLTLTMSGLSGNGGIMYDCLKMETGNAVTNGISNVISNGIVTRTDIFTISGTKIGSYNADEAAKIDLPHGIYIFKSNTNNGTKSVKVIR